MSTQWERSLLWETDGTGTVRFQVLGVSVLWSLIMSYRRSQFHSLASFSVSLASFEMIFFYILFIYLFFFGIFDCFHAGLEIAVSCQAPCRFFQHKLYVVHI